MGRTEMKVAIIDPNMIHRTRLQKTFEHLGPGSASPSMQSDVYDSVETTAEV